MRSTFGILFIFLLLNENADAQIGIYRTGHDRLTVTNNRSNSLSLQVGNRSRILIAGYSSKEIDFSLNYNNLSRTPLTTYYDYNAYRLDSLLCVNKSEREKVSNDNFHALFGLLAALFREDMDFEVFLLAFKGLGSLFNISTSKLDRLIDEIVDVWKDNIGKDQKKIRMEALIRSYFDQRREINANRDQCVDNAFALLGKIPASTFYAINFISKQLRSFVELSPFYVTGTRIRMYHGAGTRQSINRLDYSSQPSYGVRLAYAFNAYDRNGRRKVDTRYYIPATYTQTSAVYKQLPDSVFKDASALSWKTVSIGFGWSIETYNKSGITPVSALFFDIGAISSVLTEHEVANNKILSSKRVSSFKGIAPYLNIGYKHRVAGPLDIFGSFYSTFLYSGKSLKNDLPNFYQFHLGLNLRFSGHKSYQY